jgi:hypothetical protein
MLMAQWNKGKDARFAKGRRSNINAGKYLSDKSIPF